MKRTVDDAVDTLGGLIRDWVSGTLRPGLRVLVYPPESEAAMLIRLTEFEQTTRAVGRPIEVVDVGQLFLAQVEPRADQLQAGEGDLGMETILGDLSAIASGALRALLGKPLDPPAICRLLVNTSSLATFVSYSSITNDTYADVIAPTVLAFPGEGDARTLNLLHLRADTSYRVARI